MHIRRCPHTSAAHRTQIASLRAERTSYWSESGGCTSSSLAGGACPHHACTVHPNASKKGKDTSRIGRVGLTSNCHPEHELERHPTYRMRACQQDSCGTLGMHSASPASSAVECSESVLLPRWGRLAQAIARALPACPLHLRRNDLRRSPSCGVASPRSTSGAAAAPSPGSGARRPRSAFASLTAPSPARALEAEAARASLAERVARPPGDEGGRASPKVAECAHRRAAAPAAAVWPSGDPAAGPPPERLRAPSALRSLGMSRVHLMVWIRGFL